jgi:hypothetical protein
LSHFLLSCLTAGRCSCSLDRFVMVVAPGHAHLHAIKSCTVTDFWLRDSLYRDTAPVPAQNFVTGEKFAAPIKPVPRYSYNSQNLYLDGKKCAIPSLHRDNFLAKVPAPSTRGARMLRRVIQPPHIAGPLAVSRYHTWTRLELLYSTKTSNENVKTQY